jgi:hypothetical protein
MKFASRSKVLAVVLAMGTASMAASTSAQAGIGSSIKGAAKSVGTAGKSLGGAVTHPSRIVSAAKAGAAGVKQVGGTVLIHVPGAKGVKAAVKAVANGEVKFLGKKRRL